MTDFAKRLSDEREEWRMSQACLARITGLHPSAINHWEKGRRTPTIKNLKVLCEALHVSADKLLGINIEGPNR